MPTSARTSLVFFGQFADVGIRAPEQNGLLQQALIGTMNLERVGHCRQQGAADASSAELLSDSSAGKMPGIFLAFHSRNVAGWRKIHLCISEASGVLPSPAAATFPFQTHRNFTKSRPRSNRLRPRRAHSAKHEQRFIAG